METYRTDETRHLGAADLLEGYWCLRENLDLDVYQGLITSTISQLLSSNGMNEMSERLHIQGMGIYLHLPSDDPAFMRDDALEPGTIYVIAVHCGTRIRALPSFTVCVIALT